MESGKIAVFALVGIVSIAIIGLLVFVVWMSLAKTEAGLPIGGYSFANYVDLFSDIGVARAAQNTLIFSLITVCVAALMGLPMGWLAERTDLPGKSAIWTILVIGLLIPGFFTAMGWLFLFDPQIGFINRLLMQWLSLSEAPISITNIVGMGFIEGLTLAPVFFLMTANSFRAMDPTLEEAARASGSSAFQLTRRIVLPLMLPSVLAASIFTFTIALGTFDVPGIIGLSNRVFTFSTFLYVKMTTIEDVPNYGLPAAFGSVMLCFAMALSIVYVRLLRHARRYEVITGKGYRPRLIQLGGWSVLGWLFVGTYVLFSLVLPFLLVLWSSLLAYYQPPSLQALKQISFATYGEVPWDIVWRGLENSLIIAVVVPTAVVIISVSFSWTVLRSKIRGRLFLDGVAFLPQAVPGLIFSLGAVLFALFALPKSIQLYGSITSVILVYTVSWTSFGTRAMNSALIQVHGELEEASYASGASHFETMRRVLFPLLRPAIASAWIWLALLSLRELTRAVILVASPHVTLPIVTWGFWNNAQYGSAAVVVLITLVLFTPALLLYFYFGRRNASVAAR